MPWQPTRPELTGSFGMVASTHWLASSCGMSVLEAGGNAFDAAVAAGFVLQVVEPHMNGPAGEVPIVLWSARDQAVHVVCGQGVAPVGATVDAFRQLDLDTVPGTGLLPATVPGAFGAWMLLLERWGTWRPSEVLRFAIEYARSGYPAGPTLVAAIGALRELFTTEWTTSAALWLRGSSVPTPGSWLRAEGLAATYERILEEAEHAGPAREQQIRGAVQAWYRGFVAEEIDRFCRETSWRDTSGRSHSGLLSADDMARWDATVEAPARYDYRGLEVFKTGLWGQGPVFLQQLALLSGFELPPESLWQGEAIHTVLECAKLAFADREAWYGDSAPPGVLDHLLSREYNDRRRREVGEDASDGLRPGQVAGRAPWLPGPVLGDGAAEGPVPDRGAGEPVAGPSGVVGGDTCHLDVADRHGNLVSATPSGAWLQSSPAIPALGFCLGTRGQMFNLDPGHPNALRPGARPRTTLSPSLAFREGEPWLAFGTPGGDQQDQWTLLFFLNVVHGGLDLQAAIDAPMYHSEHFPSSFFPHDRHPRRVVAEDRLDNATRGELARRGHDVRPSDPWSLGRVSAVGRDGPVLRAAANARGAQGYAVGR